MANLSLFHVLLRLAGISSHYRAWSATNRISWPPEPRNAFLGNFFEAFSSARGLLEAFKPCSDRSQALVKRLGSVYDEMWVGNQVMFLNGGFTKENLERIPIRLMMHWKPKGLAAINALLPE